MKRRMTPRASSLAAMLLVLFLGSIVGSIAGAGRGGRALGQTSQPATPGPRLRLEGTLTLSPGHGPWGTPLTISGTGLTPSSDYSVIWTSAEGAWKLANNNSEYKGREYSPVERVLAQIQTDAQGTFELDAVVPEDFGFQHDIQVRQGGEIRNKAGFDVDLQVTISPSSGPVGTPITVEAKGIGWRTYENSWGVSYDNTFTGWISAVTTKGYARAVIPATGSLGVHIITVLHGDFTFPYLNMQQSPEPDRPQFHIPFTVTDGAPVLPSDPSAQLLPVSAMPAPVAGAAIWADPPEGIVGSQAMIRGKALPPNTDVVLTWTTMFGNRVSPTDAGINERGDQLAVVRTDADGTFTWKLEVPDDLGGSHAITARSGDAVLAESSFTIQPSAQRLSVARGPSGTQFMIQINGVGWTETANIYHTVYDNAYAGYECGFNSHGNVQVFMYASGAPGWHFIDLYPGIYKGVETRPLNFRIPQLTYAADHPGENLPAFHFAFYITP